MHMTYKLYFQKWNVSSSVLCFSW